MGWKAMVIDLNKGKISEEGKVLWKVLTYFASEAEVQLDKIGPTKNWFTKETNQNYGANYLYGLCYTYMDYYGHVYNPLNEKEVEITKKIYDHLWEMQDKEKIWSTSALAQDNAWRDLRILSKKALDALSLPLHPLKAPFWFPDVIDIAHYGNPNA